MKIAAFCLISVAFFGIAAAATTATAEEAWFVPTEDGQFVWYSKARFDVEFENVHCNDSPVNCYLYTKSNPSSPQRINVNDVQRRSAAALSKSHFNKANPMRITIHGWKGDYRQEVNTEMHSALLATGVYNFFCADWSAQAQTTNDASARNAVRSVGGKVAAFVDFLNVHGMKFNALEGSYAHVAGYTGKLAKHGEVHAMYGLGIAMPLFSYSDCATRFCIADASYVESIPTNGGVLGLLQPIGKSAFYPNGGRTQSGCGADVKGSCAHARSVTYYAEAIRKNDFPTMKCSTYGNAVDRNCGSTHK